MGFVARAGSSFLESSDSENLFETQQFRPSLYDTVSSRASLDIQRPTLADKNESLSIDQQEGKSFGNFHFLFF